jgi:hypothetical protein
MKRGLGSIRSQVTVVVFRGLSWGPRLCEIVPRSLTWSLWAVVALAGSVAVAVDIRLLVSSSRCLRRWRSVGPAACGEHLSVLAKPARAETLPSDAGPIPKTESVGHTLNSTGSGLPGRRTCSGGGGLGRLLFVCWREVPERVGRGKTQSSLSTPSAMGRLCGTQRMGGSCWWGWAAASPAGCLLPLESVGCSGAGSHGLALRSLARWRVRSLAGWLG